jgi:hypothetical protein
LLLLLFVLWSIINANWPSHLAQTNIISQHIYIVIKNPEAYSVVLQQYMSA